MQADLFPNANLFAYLEKISIKETIEQKSLREQVGHLELATMQISPLQAQLLRFLLITTQAKHCLEIGTYCGYSAMLIAQTIPDDGHLYTCDINTQTTQLAKRAWQDAKIAHKITLQLSPAVKTLLTLSKTHKNYFDFIFIDADKTNYPTYYLLGKDLLRSGGLMIIDNITWDGKVAHRQISDRQTRAIKRCNELISTDDEITSCIIPLGDGMFLITKK